MLRIISATLFLICAIPLCAEQHQELTPAVADAIIELQESSKAENKAARLEELNKAEVLSEGEGTLPDGRKVIIREVMPPALETPEKPAAELSPSPQFTPEQLEWIEAQQQLQNHKVQMLSCTVYDRSLTQVRWTYDGEKFVAFTNADFNYLGGILTVSTETDRYDYFFGIGNVSSEQLEEPLRALPAFSPDRSEYVLIEGDSTNAAATAGLEALLAYYDANVDSLKVAYQRSQALAAAQKRYKEANPEQPEDFIFQFWVPEKEAPR